MSTVATMFKTIEKLYTIDRIITALQKKPHDYDGVLIHANEAHTLKLIGEHEGISQAELSEQMFRTNGATSMVVDKLVARGLVHRTREEGNQRRYLLTLTPRGWDVHRAHMAYDESHARHAVQVLDMDEEELLLLNEQLEKIIQFYAENYLSHGHTILKSTKK